VDSAGCAGACSGVLWPVSPASFSVRLTRARLMACAFAIWVKQKNETCMGGHAVLALGFDEKKQAFKVRNSWGKGWGVSQVPVVSCTTRSRARR
jgi:hypothetical protein